jgi:prepilin-type N-terminal cleavage/methylation domain-containing protein
MSKPIQKQFSAGFTFLEVVIAISILAVIMGVTYSSLNQIIRSKKILDDARDGKAIADSILIRMTREFQQAASNQTLLPPRTKLNQPYPGSPKLYAERKKTDSGQELTSITFITLAQPTLRSEPQFQSEYIQVTYRVEPDPEDPNKQRLRLIREEVPLLSPPATAYKRALAFPVSQDIVQFEFLFYDFNKEAWVESWGKSRNYKLPPLVELLFSIRSPLGSIQTYSTVIALPKSKDSSV